MPPKVKTTKEMIIKAAFEITRKNGIDAVNAKSVANYLKCSTQPVMYNFATIEELKMTVFDKAFTYMKEQVVFLGVGLDFQPVIEAFAKFLNTSVEEARAEWLIRYFMVHGIACGIVNQKVDYLDEQLIQFMIRFDAGRM